MIKKHTKPTTVSLTPREKRIKHIISKLYKIKSINRKKVYDTKALQKIVWNHKVGKEVIEELRDERITEEWLIKNWQYIVAEVLGPKLL